MNLRIPLHRGIVIAVYAMILVTMLAIFIAVQSFGNANSLLLLTILLIPVTAITTSLLSLPARVRIAGYLIIAIASIPIILLGLPGGWGLLFSIGLIFLIWGAWFERWG